MTLLTLCFVGLVSAKSLERMVAVVNGLYRIPSMQCPLHPQLMLLPSSHGQFS